jgi:hypothetical protein
MIMLRKMRSNRIPGKAFVQMALVLTGMVLTGCKSQQWEPLFNGKDLAGWSVKCIPDDRDKEYWTVEDDCIACNSMGDKDHNYVWLVT